MKSRILAFCLLCTVASAQQSRPVRVIQNQTGIPQSSGSAQALPENYVLNLILIQQEKTVTDLSLITGSSDFSINFPNPNLNNITNFMGTLTLDEEGSALVRYTLSYEVPMQIEGQGVQYRGFATHGLVRLQPGVPVQIIKADGCICRLSVAKAPDPAVSSK